MIQVLAELDALIEGPARPLKLPQDAWSVILSRLEDGEELSLGTCANEFYGSPQTYDLAVFFDALQQHAPAVDGLDDATIESILRLEPDAPAAGYERFYEQVRAAGCEAMQCAVTGGVLISLDRPAWDFDRAAVICGEASIEFDHASRVQHAEAIGARQHQQLMNSLSPQNFNAVRERVFPSLRWGQEVAGQIEVFPAEYLHLAFKRLAKLNSIVSAWSHSESNLPDFAGLEIRPESDLTMQNYAAARRFRSATGDIRTYEKHVTVTSGTRIHLIVDDEARSIEIGYIGVHLPTWKFS